MDQKIAGAGLDSFEREPLGDDSYLWRLEGTLITPRIAGIGPHFWQRVHENWITNLKSFLADESMSNEIDKVEWKKRVESLSSIETDSESKVEETEG